MTDIAPTDTLVFPSSPGQQRLWFLDQINPAAGAAYGLSVRLDLHGTVDPVALQRALDAVVARHEALRTGLRRDGDRLVQVVLPGVSAPLQVIARAGTGPDFDDQIDRLLSFISHRGWNLATPPLLRALLVRRDAERSVLLLCVHHAVCDGLSLQVVLEELLAAYRQAVGWEPIEFSGRPMQFADYVVWSAGGAEPGPEWHDRRRDRLDHWWRIMRGAPDVLDLPTDHRRPAAQGFAGAREPVRVDASLARRLRTWAAGEGVSVSTAALTAFLSVLHRGSGADDLVVGIPVANRCHPDLAGTVGFLSNTCPLRARISAGLSLRALAHQVDDSVADLLEHSDVPFGDLVGVLNPPRLLDRNPVFQTMFGFQPDVPRGRDLPGLRVEISDVDTRTARVDLSLFLFEEAGGEISGFLEYATALFGAATARRLARQWLAVLAQLPADSDVPVSSVRLSAEPPAEPGERAEPPARPWPMPWTRVRAYARTRPGAPAVCDDTTTMSYGELAERVTAAAAALRRAGVRPGSRVAVHLGRGADIVVAALACLAAKAIYVPVDPAAPARRRAGIFAAATPYATICADPADLADLPADVRGRPRSLRSLLTAPPAVDAASATETIDTAETPEAPAYLMFTSGSTGRPKGVVVSHENLASLLAALTERLGFRAADRLLALTTVSFDISLLELLAPLVAGATVVVAPEAAQRDGAELARRLSDPAITVAQATPAMWRMALDAGWRPGPGLRVLCGGEAMPPDIADGLTAGAAAWNLYGPTETTIWSCAGEVIAGRPVTLGGPIPATAVSVVDPELNPVPVGVCGELLIGGPGVALGYLRNPAATAARFLPDPSGGGRRVYRTGDLVRRRAGGGLDFVGRVDDQVKVRGHRIELGEVEAVLRAAPGVRDAAVAVVDHGPAARLVACLVAERAAAAEVPADPGWAAEVRRHAGTVLPPAMIPAELRIADAIPLSANGKVDRRALADAGRRLEITARRVPPRTETERRIAELWCELLDVPEVGVTDDFFALGGHSLLSSRLIQRIERDLGVSVPVADLFVEPTVARLADTVSRLRGAGPDGVAADARGDETDAEPADQTGVDADPDGWEFEPVHSPRPLELR